MTARLPEFDSGLFAVVHSITFTQPFTLTSSNITVQYSTAVRHGVTAKQIHVATRMHRAEITCRGTHPLHLSAT